MYAAQKRFDGCTVLMPPPIFLKNKRKKETVARKMVNEGCVAVVAIRLSEKMNLADVNAF
jgi:hypothetical protein